MHPLDELRGLIQTYGWAVRNVSDADPIKCISYTVGLTAHGHPEVVMSGLPPDVGTAFLNMAGEIVVNQGGRFTAGEAASPRTISSSPKRSVTAGEELPA